jgi:large subunit ribosomal protein L4
VFDYPLRRHLLYEAVKIYQAAGRAGTRKTKVRSEVAGSGRKLWRQKKTGRARVGSIRSSIWRHGGTVFGPQPFDYSTIRFPRRMRRNAIRSALSSKLRQNRIVVVENLDLPTPKTRDMLALLERLELRGRVLLVDREIPRNADLASRNLERVSIARASGLSVVDVLGHETLVLTRSAAENLVEVFAR